MQKERPKSPRKSPVLKKSGHLGHFGNFCPNGHLGHFGQPFPKNQGGHAEKKFHSGPCLHQRDRATSECGGNWTHQKPGIKKKLTSGASNERTAARNWLSSPCRSPGIKTRRIPPWGRMKPRKPPKGHGSPPHHQRTNAGANVKFRLYLQAGAAARPCPGLAFSPSSPTRLRSALKQCAHRNSACRNAPLRTEQCTTACHVVAGSRASPPHPRRLPFAGNACASGPATIIARRRAAARPRA